MPIRTRRFNDPAEPGDGLRILVSRYRPRGVSKADETWELWLPDLGPSKELHAAFYAKDGGPGLTFEEYRVRYLAEMELQGRWIDSLAKRVREGETVTLLCSSACVDPARCHRTLLRQLIEASAVRP